MKHHRDGAVAGGEVAHPFVESEHVSRFLDYPLDLASIDHAVAELESWHSQDYVAEWTGDDVISEMLEVPRRISAAIVRDAGVPVSHVVDLGSGRAVSRAVSARVRGRPRHVGRLVGGDGRACT